MIFPDTPKLNGSSSSNIMMFSLINNKVIVAEVDKTAKVDFGKILLIKPFEVMLQQRGNQMGMGMMPLGMPFHGPLMHVEIDKFHVLYSMPAEKQHVNAYLENRMQLAAATSQPPAPANNG